MYKDFTKPKFYPERLKRIPKNGFVFVCDMADLFADDVPGEWITSVLEAIHSSGSRATFMFLTKNPRRYMEFLDLFTGNMILGATVESQYVPNYSRYSRAPDPLSRLYAMEDLSSYDLRLFLSIEPIFDFDLVAFQNWIIMINPEMIFIGYDNYNHNLPEPQEDKTLELIKNLEYLGFKVYRKTLRKAWYEV
jgi:hypothetical protein